VRTNTERKIKVPNIPIEEPKAGGVLKDFIGKPVIIEPLNIMANPDPKWTTAPWQAIVWSDTGNNTWEANEMLIFAKPIVAALEAASKIKNGYIAGIVAAKGSQLWVDSSNALITGMLDKQYDEIVGVEKTEE
jgi:hypothetical protein